MTSGNSAGTGVAACRASTFPVESIAGLTLGARMSPPSSSARRFRDDPSTLEEGPPQNLLRSYCTSSEELLPFGIWVSARIVELTSEYLNAVASSRFLSATLISSGIELCIVSLLCREHLPIKLHFVMRGQLS